MDKLEKLQQQLEKTKRKIAAEKAKAAAKTRKDDTRRKILDGALIQNHAAEDPETAALLDRLRAAHLKKATDRALFGLDPLPDNENAPENARPAARA